MVIAIQNYWAIGYFTSADDLADLTGPVCARYISTLWVAPSGTSGFQDGSIASRA